MSDRSTDTRAAVIAATEKLFAERGVRETTMQDIAREAHVSVGTIYVHFTGKAGLMLHLVNAGLDALESDIATSRSMASPIARVHAAGDAYFDFAVKHPVAARYAAIRVLEPDGTDEFAEAGRVCSERVRGIVLGVAEDVRAAMGAREIPVTPMDETMIYLWALWNGTAALMLRKDGLAISPDAAHRGLEFGRRILRLSSEVMAAEAAAAAGETSA